MARNFRLFVNLSQNFQETMSLSPSHQVTHPDIVRAGRDGRKT